MRIFGLCIFLLLYLPSQLFSQSARKELLSIIESWNHLKCINLSFKYTSVDGNKDTFSLNNAGYILFSNYRCKAYHHIAGLSLDLVYKAKFVKNKNYLIKSDMEGTLFYDIENSFATTYWFMDKQLDLTFFKINQLIPPLFLTDSSNLFNYRFFQKLLSCEDTLFSKIKLDSNYNPDFLKFEICFNNNKNELYLKYKKIFNKFIIDNFYKKRFFILVDKKSRNLKEYIIYENDSMFEEYTDIKVKSIINYDKKLFNFQPINPKPAVEIMVFKDNYGRLNKGVNVMAYSFASDFKEYDIFKKKEIRLYNISSDYIILYFWNSLNIDTTSEFYEICEIAKENPDKVCIIGVNNLDESIEYIIEKYNTLNWSFSMCMGRKLSKQFHISYPPVLLFIDKKNNYCYKISDSMTKSKYILLEKLQHLRKKHAFY